MAAAIVLFYVLGNISGNNYGRNQERQRIKNDITRVFGIGDENKIPNENTLKEIDIKTYSLYSFINDKNVIEPKIEVYSRSCRDSVLIKLLDGTLSEKDLLYFYTHAEDAEKNVPDYIKQELKENAK